jgi:Fibronectin type III domain
MPLRYDTGLHFDSHLRYPGGPAAPQTRKAMNKIKLELNLKTDAQLLITGKNHKTKMSGNADFPTPDPPPAEFDPLLTEFEDSVTGVAGADNALTAALARRDNARVALENGLRVRANHVETESGGDAVKIAGAGFQLASPASPVGPLPAPQNVRINPGANSGELLVRWSRVKGAGGYILECRTHGETLGPWLQVKILTQAKYLNTGLTPGVEYSFRVRPVGTAGEGPWSDEAVKRAP